MEEEKNKTLAELVVGEPIATYWPSVLMDTDNSVVVVVVDMSLTGVGIEIVFPTRVQLPVAGAGVGGKTTGMYVLVVEDGGAGAAAGEALVGRGVTGVTVGTGAAPAGCGVDASGSGPINGPPVVLFRLVMRMAINTAATTSNKMPQTKTIHLVREREEARRDEDDVCRGELSLLRLLFRP